MNTDANTIQNETPKGAIEESKESIPPQTPPKDPQEKPKRKRKVSLQPQVQPLPSGTPKADIPIKEEAPNKRKRVLTPRQREALEVGRRKRDENVVYLKQLKEKDDAEKKKRKADEWRRIIREELVQPQLEWREAIDKLQKAQLEPVTSGYESDYEDDDYDSYEEDVKLDSNNLYPVEIDAYGEYLRDENIRRSARQLQTEGRQTALPPLYSQIFM
jgi:hypothetical protein